MCNMSLNSAILGYSIIEGREFKRTRRYNAHLSRNRQFLRKKARLASGKILSEALSQYAEDLDLDKIEAWIAFAFNY